MAKDKPAPKFGSKKMNKAIRKHDRGFAKKYGGPKPAGWLSRLFGGGSR